MKHMRLQPKIVRHACNETNIKLKVFEEFSNANTCIMLDNCFLAFVV